MAEMRLPQFGMGMSEAQIVRWLKSEGDSVEKGEPLVEIEAAKATVEVPAPVSGVLARIVAAEGVVVPVYEVLAHISGRDGTVDNASPADAVDAAPVARDRAAPRPPSTGERVSPRVRRLAAERGVDLTALLGSGPDGRIEEADVLAAAPGGAEDQI